jgi:predicted nucleic acid-binding protein
MKVFADTNILIYHSFDKGQKGKVSDTILKATGSEIFISTQVLIEFANVSVKKGLCTNKRESFIFSFNNDYSLITVETRQLLKAFEIRDRYQVSFFDSLIMATALLSNCEILYT